MLAGRRNSAARGGARSPGGYGVVDAFADRTGGATHSAKWIGEGLGEARGHARNRHTKPDPVLYRRRRQTNSWHAYLESGAADTDVSDAWSADAAAASSAAENWELRIGLERGQQQETDRRCCGAHAAQHPQPWLVRQA
jgi:hypothetical protein